MKLIAFSVGFVRTKNYDALAGVLLALTGCEAMFAKYVLLESWVTSVFLILNTCPILSPPHYSLGQFNALSIQIGFGLWVYPCLIFAYLGQGARLITEGEAAMSNIFWNTIPGPQNGVFYWITFVFALLATVSLKRRQELVCLHEY